MGNIQNFKIKYTFTYSYRNVFYINQQLLPELKWQTIMMYSLEYNGKTRVINVTMVLGNQ